MPTPPPVTESTVISTAQPEIQSASPVEPASEPTVNDAEADAIYTKPLAGLSPVKATDTATISVFEIFGLPKPSETENLRTIQAIRLPLRQRRFLVALQELRTNANGCIEYWRDVQRVDLTGYNTNENADDLEDLRKAHGKAFDKKFIRMMIIDHKRDIVKLEKATRSNDADVQVFATKYLPVVEGHLVKIKALKKDSR